MRNGEPVSTIPRSRDPSIENSAHSAPPHGASGSVTLRVHTGRQIVVGGGGGGAVRFLVSPFAFAAPHGGAALADAAAAAAPLSAARRPIGASACAERLARSTSTNVVFLIACSQPLCARTASGRLWHRFLPTYCRGVLVELKRSSGFYFARELAAAKPKCMARGSGLAWPG